MKLGWVLGLGLLATAGAASAAGVVVVRSAGPSAKSYPPGKALPESASVALQPGDMVTLLGANSARTLRGPGTFPVGASRNSLAMAAGRRSRFGAMRTDEVAQNPNLWDIDVTQSGKMCVAEPAKLKLWRPNPDSAVTLTIRSTGGAAHELNWPAGSATAPWPTALPVTNGTQYRIEWPNSVDRSDLSFVTVNAAPTDLVGAASLLIAKGCQNQLDLLVAGAEKED